MPLTLVVLSPLAMAAGFWLGEPLLLPILASAPAYAAMALLLREGRRGAALGAMLLWAVLPQHALHAGAFVALSLLTASVVSVVFGAALMNYMAYYVAELIRLTPSHPWLAALLGWHPWSIVRIVSFVTLGVLLAEPLLRRVTRAPRLAPPRALLALALAGLVVDVCLKALLAPHWAALLRSLR